LIDGISHVGYETQKRNETAGEQESR